MKEIAQVYSSYILILTFLVIESRSYMVGMNLSCRSNHNVCLTLSTRCVTDLQHLASNLMKRLFRTFFQSGASSIYIYILYTIKNNDIPKFNCLLIKYFYFFVNFDIYWKYMLKRFSC